MCNFDEKVIAVVNSLKTLSQEMQKKNIEDHKLVARRSQVQLMNPENRDFVSRLNQERLQSFEDFQETFWNVAVQSLTDEYGQDAVEEALKQMRERSE